jgi:hypothetical protein
MAFGGLLSGQLVNLALDGGIACGLRDRRGARD